MRRSTKSIALGERQDPVWSDGVNKPDIVLKIILAKDKQYSHKFEHDAVCFGLDNVYLQNQTSHSSLSVFLFYFSNTYYLGYQSTG